MAKFTLHKIQYALFKYLPNGTKKRNWSVIFIKQEESAKNAEKNVFISFDYPSTQKLIKIHNTQVNLDALKNNR